MDLLIVKTKDYVRNNIDDIFLSEENLTGFYKTFIETMPDTTIRDILREALKKYICRSCKMVSIRTARPVMNVALSSILRTIIIEDNEICEIYLSNPELSERNRVEFLLKSAMFINYCHSFNNAVSDMIIKLKILNKQNLIV